MNYREHQVRVQIAFTLVYASHISMHQFALSSKAQEWSGWQQPENHASSGCLGTGFFLRCGRQWQPPSTPLRDLGKHPYCVLCFC